MNKFLSPLLYDDAPEPGYYLLRARLAFESLRAGAVIHADAGFKTNFVTGRKLLFVRRIVTDAMNPGAVIHDVLYATGALSREMADAVFRDAMLASGVASWRAWAAWAAVRTFGGKFYHVPKNEGRMLLEISRRGKSDPGALQMISPAQLDYLKRVESAAKTLAASLNEPPAVE